MTHQNTDDPRKLRHDEVPKKKKVVPQKTLVLRSDDGKVKDLKNTSKNIRKKKIRPPHRRKSVCMRCLYVAQK